MKHMLVFALLLMGCGGDTLAGCEGEVDEVLPGTPGSVVAQGDFGEGQPILELIGPDGDTQDFPALDHDAGTATFSGLPPGLHEVRWILSCFNGEGQVTMSGPSTIDVP
jgi:hypothetical protein